MSALPQPPFTPHLILHTHWSAAEPQGAQGIHDQIHHPQVMGHQSPLFCFYLHSINHLFLMICMATLLHLAAGGSFLVSLPHLTSASWVILDSPATAPQTWPLKLPVCAPGGPCLLRSLPFPSASQALLPAPSCKGWGDSWPWQDP